MSRSVFSIRLGDGELAALKDAGDQTGDGPSTVAASVIGEWASCGPTGERACELVRRACLSVPAVRRAWVFGSRARDGMCRRDSDLDVMADVDDDSLLALGALSFELSRLLPRGIEPDVSMLPCALEHGGVVAKSAISGMVLAYDR